MTPEALVRRLFGDIGQIMYLRPNQVPQAETRWPLRTLYFLSRPRASYRAGVCETDWVTVEFELMPFELGQDPGVRPRRFQVSTQYLVQDLAKVREGDASADEMPALEAACAAIDPREATPINAATAFDVTGTIGPLADLIDAARQGRAIAPLDCRDQAGEAKAEAACLRDLARLRPDRAFNATLSPGCDRNEADLYCRNASVFDVGEVIEIKFEFRRGTATPTRISVQPALDTSAVE